jgi:hypothetical protein
LNLDLEANFRNLLGEFLDRTHHWDYVFIHERKYEILGHDFTLFHVMFINLVNPCFLNVVLSMYMIIRVEICIGSLKLEVFEEN